MTQEIKKLNKLIRPESFIQINTVKGFKYIDRAGEIVNRYHNEQIAPQFSMSLEGLVINTPKDEIAQLKVSSQIIWMKFNKIDSFEKILSQFEKESGQILKILEVEKINRIGWRTYFIHEFKNQAEQNECLKKINPLKNSIFEFSRLNLKTDTSFNANLKIQPVIKSDKNPTYGILFDVDLFQTKEIPVTKMSELLKALKDYLNGEKLLEALNEIISK